jgi:phosphoribosylformylglycinamidine (FGAM) synthase PurS component
MHLLPCGKNIKFISLITNFKKVGEKMLKKIFYSITLLLVPIFFYSCGTVGKTGQTGAPTIALVVKSAPKIALAVRSAPPIALAVRSAPPIALAVRSVPDVEQAKNNDKIETVEEKVYAYTPPFTKKETVEADVPEVARIKMDDLPTVSQTIESETTVQQKVYPHGPQRIYSIQTGSFKIIANAEYHFNSLISEFNEKDIDYLRIVKIGQYYAVRLGKFDDYAVAKKYLIANQPLLSSAIILDNYPGKLIKAKKDLDRDWSQKIYSVQTASFVSAAAAQDHFESVIRELDGKDTDYVRIVKIGKYFAVRLGKFDDYAVAKKFLKANQYQLSSAIILDNYPLRKSTEEKVYAYSPPFTEKETVETDVPEAARIKMDDLPTVSQTIESETTVQQKVYPHGTQRIYSIQTGSFERIARAQNHFESLIREFDGKGTDYVRIVKIGKYFAVRLGKFDDYAVAKRFLKANQPLLSSAIILDNYPRN